MADIKKIKCDVAVIGGGPAGISAALELGCRPNLDVYLFENEKYLGGIPRSAHVFFGMRDLKRAYSGKGYARRLDKLLRRTSVKICTQSTVVEITTGGPGRRHCLTVSSPDGLMIYESRHVLLAMGCFESSRGSRMISGTRPSGVITTGTLQKTVNLEHMVPGRRAVILGSENVALSAALTLHKAGVEVKALVEPEIRLDTYEIAARGLSYWLGFPVIRGCTELSVYGRERVEGVSLSFNNGSDNKKVPCDTLVVTGKFKPEATLLYDSGIELDPYAGGPVVDGELQTSVKGIWAAGNLLRGANMHDLCALEGRKAAGAILRRIDGGAEPLSAPVHIRPQMPIRFVTPQKVVPRDIRQYRMPWLGSGYFFQVSRSLNRVVLSAMSGSSCIWRKKYRNMMGNHAYRLPVEKFDWSIAPETREIRLICENK